MNSKIQACHLKKHAYIYIRQSTPGQLINHQESTERQYAFKETSQNLGWPPQRIRVLDRDLGLSGAQATKRKDFQVLLKDTGNGEVGAIFALEASRLARSCLDWHHLIRICALTGTLVIDEDGCYDPADFNDSLLLGLKGTIAQAELHFIRARLQGAKLNKARKGELRFPLPVGLCYNEENLIVLDPDREVQNAIRLVFAFFKQGGTAFTVVKMFAEQNLLFPKRAYGGAWAGKLAWDHLTHSRVLGILKNPSYAGTYVYGRFRGVKEVGPDNQIEIHTRQMPMDSWLVKIHDHHEGYISWEEHLENQVILTRNRTNGEAALLSGPAREGLTLLQGLLICAKCGRRLTIRYKNNGKNCPSYLCSWRRRDGLATADCLSVNAEVLDQAVSQQALEVLNPVQLQLAIEGLKELEKRDEALLKQWRMRVQRAEYLAQLAEKRYCDVDSSNRLVAETLEQRWNDALSHLDKTRQEFDTFVQTNARVATKAQKEKVLALAKNFPRIWNAPTTHAKDKKRMLRLILKDITVEKDADARQIILHIRWQGGLDEDLPVALPLPYPERIRYTQPMVCRVQELSKTMTDTEIAQVFNQEGLISAKGKAFTVSMIQWIRHKHGIPSPQLKAPGELTVNQVMDQFRVSRGMVYYWIERDIIQARRVNRGPYWIVLDSKKRDELEKRVCNSTRFQRQPDTRDP